MSYVISCQIPPRGASHRDTREVDIFVASKLKDVAAYDEVKEKVEHYKALMDCEEMTRRIHSYCILPSRFWLMLDRD